VVNSESIANWHDSNLVFAYFWSQDFSEVCARRGNVGTEWQLMHNTVGVEATASEFWQKLKIPPPSNLDGRVGRKSPSAALNTSGSYKRDAKSAKAVGLPSPRNLT